MACIDSFVRAVPSSGREAYLRHAREMGEVIRAAGARRIAECWGDAKPHGTLTDFHRSVLAEAEETVVVGWIEWPSKVDHDEGWAKLMADPRIAPGTGPMPFDGKRMIHGAFVTILDVGGSSDPARAA